MSSHRILSIRLGILGILSLAGIALNASSAQAAISSDWVGGASSWTTPGNWSHTPSFSGYPDNVGSNNFSVTVKSGISTVTQSITVDSLAINNSAKVVLAAGIDSLFHTGNLSINNTIGGAVFDVNDNCVIVDLESDTTIRNYLFSGHNSGTWNGPGIISTVAANDLVSPGYYTGIAYAKAGDLGIGTYGGASVGVNSIVMRYTYMGDADFDGQVTPADYALLNNGFANSLTGWVNGDFDYNGIIDANDYAIIDASFLTQGAPIIDNCIPEPASLGILFFSGSALLKRRRKI